MLDRDKASCLRRNKKDPETIEELDRQLRYMERSITQLKVNTIKNENRTKLHIKKKTDENQKLINEINAMKKNMNELSISNKLLKNQIRDYEENVK